MYEELVKRLREHGEFLIVSDRMKAPPNVNVRNVFAEDYYQAADAIEILIEERDSAYLAGHQIADKLPVWIRVEERLPEQRKWVLCACRSNIFCVMRWDGVDWYENPTHIYMSGFVTHWMPLPEPPKEET